MEGEPRYPYVEASVLAEDADEAGALLFELGAQGVEHRDTTTLLKGALGTTMLIASFDDSDRAREVAAQLPAAWLPRFGEVIGDTWRDEWKKHFEPFAVCASIVIRPPWRAYESAPGERVIILEPGRAFGTGLHETTSLVAQALVDRADDVRGSSVLDVGCGSGILGLIALALGAKAVRAVDIDPDAVAVARENAERNAYSHQLSAEGTRIEDIDGSFDLVLANIEAKTLVLMASALSRRVAPGGRLMLSGILRVHADGSQWTEVCAAFAGMRVEEVCEKGEWLAAVLRA